MKYEVGEKSICTECEDGWMVKRGPIFVCNHCGHEVEVGGKDGN